MGKCSSGSVRSTARRELLKETHRRSAHPGAKRSLFKRMGGSKQAWKFTDQLNKAKKSDTSLEKRVRTRRAQHAMTALQKYNAKGHDYRRAYSSWRDSWEQYVVHGCKRCGIICFKGGKLFKLLSGESQGQNLKDLREQSNTAAGMTMGSTRMPRAAAKAEKQKPTERQNAPREQLTKQLWREATMYKDHKQYGNDAKSVLEFLGQLNYDGKGQHNPKGNDGDGSVVAVLAKQGLNNSK